MFEVLDQLGRSLASARDRGEADVRGDCVQPGAELRARLVAVGAFPRAQHRFLDRVVRVVERTEHPIAVQVQRPAMWLDQERERCSSIAWGTLLGRRAGRLGTELGPFPGGEGAG